MLCIIVFFFQAEDGIRDVERSRGLGDVYKRQVLTTRVSSQEKPGYEESCDFGGCAAVQQAR